MWTIPCLPESSFVRPCSQNSSHLYCSELSRLFGDSITTLLGQAWSLCKCLGAAHTRPCVFLPRHKAMVSSREEENFTHCPVCSWGFTAGHTLMRMDVCHSRASYNWCGQEEMADQGKSLFQVFVVQMGQRCPFPLWCWHWWEQS